MKRREIMVTGLISLFMPHLGRADASMIPLSNEGSWDEIKGDIIGEDPILDGSKHFKVDLPIRAEDAAIVPIRVRQITQQPIQKMLIVIDENPAPVAGEFVFAPALNPLDFETRIRVDRYSNVRVIATIDDQIYMNGHFVKASGGCSAPASKDPEEAAKGLGKMQFREFGEGGAQSMPRREAQIKIRHPNYSGLQRDQITQLFVPAMFIHSLEVNQGDAQLFTMSGGISISEDPSFRFAFQDNGDTHVSIRAMDTDGRIFEESFEKSKLMG